MMIATTVYNYWHFSRRNAQYLKLCYLSQNLLWKTDVLSKDTQEKLSVLNDQRIALQNMIGRLNLFSLGVCIECRGNCCQGSAQNYYFTVIDYRLRQNSGNPLPGHGIIQPRSFYLDMHRRFKKLFFVSAKKTTDLQQGCHELSLDGCRLDYAQRPIMCVLFTCAKLRQAMDINTKKKYVKHIDKLFVISLNTFGLLKREAGLPSLFGRLAIHIFV